MGFAKRQMEEDEERGWSSVGEKWCCADHVEDDALEALIADEAASTVCSYCGGEAKEPFAAAVDLIVERFAESLPQEWGGADEETIPWEGGYVWKTLDTWDLITDGLNWPLNNSDLIQDVVSALPEQAWVQRDFYRLTPSERLRFAWSDFIQVVKHERRYFFSDHSAEEADALRDRDEMTPGEMLTAIGGVVVEAGLVRTLHPGEKLFRARSHGCDETLDGAVDLGAPEADRVHNSSRMSPAGVSVFYGAFDPATAREEARSANPERSAITVGRFEVTRPLRVVDLSRQPDVPSLLDPERALRPGHIFLRHFVDEIAKPFVHDEVIHIEYVPTQIVTEWFASEFPGGLDGLLYRSSRSSGGVNATLFFDERGCRDPDDVDEETSLVFRDVDERSEANGSSHSELQ
jgi:hypothetical protein